MAGLPTGIMGNLMYMAKQSADAEAARRAELAQQQMDMMQKGYDVNQAPERGGNAFFNALTRSFAYDPSMDPTPTYTRNEYNPEVMEREKMKAMEDFRSWQRGMEERRFDKSVSDSDREALQRDRELDMQKQGLLNEEKRIDIQSKETDARVALYGVQKVGKELDNELQEALRDSALQLRDLEVEAARFNLAKNKTGVIETKDGRMIFMQYDKDGNVKLEHLMDLEPQADPTSYIRNSLLFGMKLYQFASETGDADLMERVQSMVGDLMDAGFYAGIQPPERPPAGSWTNAPPTPQAAPVRPAMPFTGPVTPPGFPQPSTGSQAVPSQASPLQTMEERPPDNRPYNPAGEWIMEWLRNAMSQRGSKTPGQSYWDRQLER